jgi:two-component system, NtrC family, sensor kinase
MPEGAHATPPAAIAELEARVAALTAERDAALARETAIAEVLHVINSSPGDLAPVFAAMLEKAMRLCEAAFGVMHTYDGKEVHLVAAHGIPPRFAEFAANPSNQPGPGGATPRLAAGARFVHVADLMEEEAYRAGDPYRRALVDLGGARTLLAVPLRKDGAMVGQIAIYRQEVRAYGDKQVALLENFAAQAVIAMENARLLTETREALEQQTATAEVLQVINSSPGDLPPVFDAMLEKALNLCEASLGLFYRFENDAIHALAFRGTFNAPAEILYQPVPVEPNSAVGALARGTADFIHNLDITDDDIYRAATPSRLKLVEFTGARTALWVALRKDERLIGTFIIYRQEVRPFSDKEIALLQNFAAQAVIAMENARLITETRESLAFQTATSDVLKVISRSTFDLQPVLENVMETALRLCRAHMGSIFRLVEDGAYRWAVGSGLAPEYEEIERQTPILPGPDTLVGRVAAEGRTVQIADAEADAAYAPKDEARVTRASTMLGVPLLREGVPIGVIAMARDRVEPFSDKEVALVTTFADQAVIAIENVRLFEELRARTRDLEESLEYQTATSDVLQVISRSTFDLQPVLDTLLQTAARLCNGPCAALAVRQGEGFGYVATTGMPELDPVLRGRTFVPGRGSMLPRVLAECGIVHMADLQADPEYNFASLGLHSALGVPMLREDEVIGVLTLARDRVEPFTERQIELVRTFADQAVIAIENTRLLTELRESLEQQQAMAEVLQVINRSPGDLQPVFETILQKSHLLCEATLGTLFLYDGEKMSAVATFGYPEDVAAVLRNGIRPPPPLLDGARLVHRHDIREGANEDIRAGADEAVRLVSQRGGVRTNLIIPLRKDGLLQGMISCNRQEVRPYTDKQIALLENFAAQAVIAMDNARLLDEIRQRQAELRVTFDNMGDGVAMFDADLKLAAWNRNFEQILDVPNEVLAERPSYEDYLRFLAERGEFGTEDVEAELTWRLERTDEEIRFERARPDARVIEVRRNAVPGGGFVLIYGDITERKRAEAEIRAARDAAEKALAELSATQQQLVQQQKMAALGQLTAGIAHEIKNPLNFVNNFAGLSNELLAELREAAAPAFAALDADSRADIDETIQMLSGNLDKIAEHGRRADNIVKSMLDHSRGGSGDRRSVDLNTLIDEALNLAYHGARAQDQNFNIALERDFAEGIAPIELVPQDVTRVFLNLIGNGFYAAAKKTQAAANGGFRPMLRIATRDLGDVVEVRVRDNGTGIAPEIRDKLFQPFVTTKPTGEGTGLGLSISYDIVTQQHGGSIAVDSEPGAFTEFTVRLPRTSSPRRVAAGAA